MTLPFVRRRCISNTVSYFANQRFKLVDFCLEVQILTVTLADTHTHARFFAYTHVQLA